MIKHLIKLTSVLVSYSALIAQAATYYVAPNGDNANTGATLDAPVKNIQRAMDKVNPGDTVYVRGGVYREQVEAYRGGSADNYVNLFAYPGETPVIKGSDIVTGWTQYNSNIWMKSAWPVNSQQVFVDFDDNQPSKPLQQIGMPSKYIGNWHYRYPVGSDVSSMTPGSFYYDNASSTLYVWLADGSDPNKHTIEASTRRRLLFMGRPYINTKGFAFRHSNSNAFAEQDAAVSLNAYCILSDSDVQYADFAGVGMSYMQYGSQVINSNISNNGNSGINAVAAYDFRISGVKMNNNNYRNFNPLWHAGGFKGVAKAYGTIENSEVAFNNGSGIWFDYANSGNPITIKGNYVHDNGPVDAAIFLEVSKNALIVNNVIANNTRRGIYIAASDQMQVLNNTIVGTSGFAAVNVAGMPRGGATLTNNTIANNIISGSNTLFDLIMMPNNGNDIYGNNSFNNNIFRSNGPLKLWSGMMYNDLQSWINATGLDVGSLNITPGFTTNPNNQRAQSFRLDSNSPLIDRGAYVPALTNDFDRTPRPQIGAYDIGAFEFIPGQ